MKKIILLAAYATLSLTAFSQANLVKQATKEMEAGEYSQALETIKPALDFGTAQEKANAWNTYAEINYQIVIAAQTIDAQNKVKQESVPYDTLAMNTGIIEALNAAIVCDGYDNEPDAKGKVKVKYRPTNQQKYQNFRLNVINAGMYFYNKGNKEKAVEAWKLYIESQNAELFTGLDMSQDQYKIEVAYFAALAAYQIKDYETAITYGSLAATDSAKMKDASDIVIFAMKDSSKSHADTLAYLQKVKELHQQMPNEERYYNLLSDYYTKKGNLQDMIAWCNEEIALNPENKMAYAYKGQAYMNDEKWDEAVEAYKKAMELDPYFTQVVFNIGICLNSKAIELKDQLADKNTGMLTNENADKVKVILADAKIYLEKSKEQDPNREKVNWAYPLYQIYYALGDDANATEMENILNNK